MSTKTLVTLLFASAFASVATSSETITIQGAGSTFVAPLMAKWTEAYNKANPNVKVDYSATGSGGGIKGITDRTIHFGATDGPMTNAQLAQAPGAILHIPAVSGPIVMIYNLPGVNAVNLNGEVIADIYLGKITKWNDARIAALNAGAALPAKDIVVVHRSDGSGTTWIFTNYLCKVSADFKTKVDNANSVRWPVGMGGNKNPGVAAAVKNAEGAIGYVELSYAVEGHFSYATQINKDGKPVRASMDGVIAAQKNSLSEFPADMRVSITNAGGGDSYPICGFVYLLLYQDMSYLKDKTKAAEVVKFAHWCITEGQAMANPNYSPLPVDVQKKVVEKLKTIVFDGEALLK